MNIDVNWLLVVAGGFLILVEVLLGAAAGFDFLLIGSAILVGGILGLVADSATLGLAAAGVLSLAYVFVGRNRIRGRLKRPGIPSNTDAILGRTGLVVDLITPNRPGRIKVEGEEWRALPDSSSGTSASSIPVGAHVRISRIDGVTVFVVPQETQNVLEGERP